MLRNLLVTTCLSLLLLLAACGGRPTPTPTLTPAPTSAPPTATPAPADIVTTAMRTENLTTFVSAVQAADLVEKLQSPGPFTVFAPTDEAFAALPAGLLDRLLNDPAGELTDVLIYHVIADNLTSAQLTDGQQIITILDDPLNVTVQDDFLKIDTATVLTRDIATTNGVIHVIDQVLLPPAITSGQ